MSRFRTPRTAVVAPLAAAALAVSGCGGSAANRSGGTGGLSASDAAATRAAAVQIPGVDRTQAARDGLAGLRDALAAQKAQVDRTSAALAEVMQGQGELVPAFQKYTLSIQDAKAARDRVRQQVETMRAKARDYITGWEVEVYGVDDPELRRQAEARRNTVRSNYARVNEAAKATGAAYDRYDVAASDLQRFLANDLTRNGVAAAASAAGRATAAGADLSGKIDTAAAEIDRVTGEMTPAGPAGNGGAR